MTDRSFTMAFTVSVGLHLVVLIAQLLGLSLFGSVRSVTPLEVVYEANALHREVEAVEQRIATARREATLSTAAAPIGERPQIRIPDRPIFSMDAVGAAAGFVPEREAVVDLTNLVAAAGGNPVLLSYFSVIREQIQQTANSQAWSASESVQGMVMVSFVLSANGTVQGAAVLSEKSAPSDTLRDIAVRIVRNAAPFPPFPPSIRESSKQIVVPLEFLLGM